jgi:hypothetical protein
LVTIIHIGIAAGSTLFSQFFYAFVHGSAPKCCSIAPL